MVDRQGADDGVLGEVGVLVLVDQHVAEPGVELGADVRVLLEDRDRGGRAGRRSRRPTTRGAAPGRPRRPWRRRPRRGRPGPVRRASRGLTRSFLARLMAASIRSGVTAGSSRSSRSIAVLDGAEPVGLVVDREAAIDARPAGRSCRSSRAQRPWKVPTQTPESGASASIRSRISPAALLVKVMARMFSPAIPWPQQVGDPPGDDPRLARARAGQDQQRPVDVGDGLALGGGQVGEQVHGVGFILRRLVWSEC